VLDRAEKEQRSKAGDCFARMTLDLHQACWHIRYDTSITTGMKRGIRKERRQENDYCRDGEEETASRTGIVSIYFRMRQIRGSPLVPKRRTRITSCIQDGLRVLRSLS
jgi:hypothetical protein